MFINQIYCYQYKFMAAKAFMKTVTVIVPRELKILSEVIIIFPKPTYNWKKPF
jgi:hypothetical protein